MANLAYATVCRSLFDAWAAAETQYFLEHPVYTEVTPNLGLGPGVWEPRCVNETLTIHEPLSLHGTLVLTEFTETDLSKNQEKDVNIFLLFA